MKYLSNKKYDPIKCKIQLIYDIGIIPPIFILVKLGLVITYIKSLVFKTQRPWVMLTKALTLQVNFVLWNIIKVVFVRNEIIYAQFICHSNLIYLPHSILTCTHTTCIQEVGYIRASTLRPVGILLFVIKDTEHICSNNVILKQNRSQLILL